MCHGCEECDVLLHDHLHFGLTEASGLLLSMRKMLKSQPWEFRSASESSYTALIFFIPGNRRHWRFYCIWTEDTPNKLPSFNLLFQSFLYLLIAALLLWDRMNWQKHFLDFLQNFNNSFTGGITLAVSQVAFIPSEKIYDFHKSMILKVCREKKHILNSAVMTNVGMILELLLVCQINVLIRL